MVLRREGRGQAYTSRAVWKEAVGGKHGGSPVEATEAIRVRVTVTGTSDRVSRGTAATTEFACRLGSRRERKMRTKEGSTVAALRKGRAEPTFSRKGRFTEYQRVGS